MTKSRSHATARSQSMRQRRKMELIDAIENDDGAAVADILRCDPSLAAEPCTPELYPLALGAISDAPKACKALLACELTDPQATADRGGLTPLMLACAHGCADAIEVIALSADLFARDRRGKTALHWAISGACELAQEDAVILIRAMAARGWRELPDDFGCTPLLLAAQRGKELIFRELLPLSDLQAQSKGPGLSSFDLGGQHPLPPAIQSALDAFREAQALGQCALPGRSKAAPSL